MKPEDAPVTTTVTIHHPQVTLLEPVASIYDSVLRGRWSIAAEICAERAADPVAQAEALDALANRVGHRFYQGEPALRSSISGDSLSIVGSEAEIMTALDLFARILCGQWSEIGWVAGLRGSVRAMFDVDDLVTLRQRHGRTQVPGPYLPLRDDEWPSHCRASIGIAGSTLPAKLAYHAYKQLGGGTAGGPTFALPDGPLTVQVDGALVNRIRQY